MTIKNAVEFFNKHTTTSTQRFIFAMVSTLVVLATAGVFSHFFAVCAAVFGVLGLIVTVIAWVDDGEYC